nr:MAG TPA: hypothetical protein [Caudoviricetes sp.]
MFGCPSCPLGCEAPEHPRHGVPHLRSLTCCFRSCFIFPAVRRSHLKN